MNVQEQVQIRRQKGQEIAKTGKVKLNGNKWIVPSQSTTKAYEVILRLDKSTCNCPDYEERQMKCKHIFAVEITVTKQINEDGTATITKRITYSQQWSEYNQAQTSELKMFDELLYDLVQNVDEPHYVFGRPTIPLREQVFCSVIKVYSQLSSRRASMLYEYAKQRGFIQHKPHFNVVSKLLNRSDLDPILSKLLTTTALPLRSVEERFAVDSSGFSTTSFSSYCREKHKTGKTHQWLKAHVAVGVKTNIIAGVEIGEEHSADSPKFIPLAQQLIANGFNMREISGDKAYMSNDNLVYADSMGATAFIPFRNGVGARGSDRSSTWTKMFYYFMYNREEFLRHYHARSNVETTFSAIKKKLGETLKSRNRQAQVNELMCKLIAYNITVLIQEMHELGIKPDFYPLG